jgi:hypothetical protein
MVTACCGPLVGTAHPLTYSPATHKSASFITTGFSNALRFALKHFPDPSVEVASSALKISLNTGREAFFGEKFKVEKVFHPFWSILMR